MILFFLAAPITLALSLTIFGTLLATPIVFLTLVGIHPLVAALSTAFGIAATGALVLLVDDP